MRAQNAATLSSEGDRSEGRGSDRHNGKRDDPYLAEKAADRLVSVTCAFLAALRRWLVRHSNSSSRQIVLPTDVVSDTELAKVLSAIFGIEAGR